MHIVFYQPGEVPDDIVSHGNSYIVDRFRQVWGVDRSKEITNDSIQGRTNIVAFNGSRLIGWLSVTSDGELVNGCAGPSRSGSIFSALLKRLFEEYPGKAFYAYVPIEYLACAYLCINAGMRAPSANHPSIKRRVYNGRVVTLVKLIMPSADEVPDSIPHRDRKERIRQLHNIISHLLDDSPVARRFIFLQRWWNILRTDVTARRAVGLFGSTCLFLGASLIYYGLGLVALGGHNIHKYLDFLSNKKPETDRNELRQYLKITTDALERFIKSADRNKTAIDAFSDPSIAITNSSEARRMGSEMHTNVRLELLEDKQVRSLDLLHDIVQLYSEEIEAGNDNGRRPRQLYAVVLQYLNEDNPYSKLIDMLKTSDLNVDQKEIRSLEDSCIVYNDTCDADVVSAIRKYMRPNGSNNWFSPFTDWIGLLTDRIRA